LFGRIAIPFNRYKNEFGQASDQPEMDATMVCIAIGLARSEAEYWPMIVGPLSSPNKLTGKGLFSYIDREKIYFSSPNSHSSLFFLINFKTGQTTSLNFSNRAFYLPRAVSKAVLLQ
jgi:hypothetical protein